MNSTAEYVLPPQTDDELTVTAETGGADYPECPAGAFVGMCCDVVYRGKQPNKFEPSKPDQHKISVHMMVDAFNEDDTPARRTDGKRFVLSSWFTRSMHPKATLRKTLAAWRGKDFDEDQAEVFKLNDLVGAFALVNVVHVKGKDGGQKAVIQSISKLPRGMQKFEAEEYIRAKDRKPGDSHADDLKHGYQQPSYEDFPVQDLEEDDLPF
jgi:hypothetical protein